MTCGLARLHFIRFRMQPSIYQSWGEKAANNAMSLAAESRLLFGAEHLPRAYYLAHMSTEESAKSILLHSMSVLGTTESDMSNVVRLLRDHKKKIEFLITYAASLSSELKAQIGNLQVDLIVHINDLKNDTMYVSCKNKNVVSPADKVSTINVEHYVQLAEVLSKHAVSLLSSTMPAAASNFKP